MNNPRQRPARSDPEVWVTALDLSQPTTAGIKVALDPALAELPSAMFDALTRRI
jgi:hypothetical protein